MIAPSLLEYLLNCGQADNDENKKLFFLYCIIIKILNDR